MRKLLNGQNRTQNCYEIVERLSENDIKFVRKSLKRDGSDDVKYIKLLDLLINKREEGISLDDLSNDDFVRNKAMQFTPDYVSLTRNFYTKLLKLIAKINEGKNDQSWYSKAKNIIDETQALFDLGMKTQAELRFKDIYKVFNANKQEIFFACHNFMTSKFIYWYHYFLQHGNYKSLHNNNFIDELRFIKKIDGLGAKYFACGFTSFSNEEYEENTYAHMIYGFWESMASYHNRKGEVKNRIELIEKQIQDFENDINYQVPYIENFPRLEGKPLEVNLMIKSLKIIEKYYLGIKSGDFEVCQKSIMELYNTYLDINVKPTNVMMFGLLLFLSNELFKMQVELFSIHEKENIENVENGFNEFIVPKWFYKPENIDDYPVRIELNKLIYQFLYSKLPSDFNSCKQLLNHFKSIPKSSGFQMELKIIGIMIDFNNTDDALDNSLRSFEYYIKNNDQNQPLEFEEMFIKLIKKMQKRIQISEVAKGYYPKLYKIRQISNPVHCCVLTWLRRWELHVYG